MSWECNWSLWWRCQRGGCWGSYSVLWTMILIPLHVTMELYKSTISCRLRPDCSAPQIAMGGLFYQWPWIYTTPLPSIGGTAKILETDKHLSCAILYFQHQCNINCQNHVVYDMCNSVTFITCFILILGFWATSNTSTSFRFHKNFLHCWKHFNYLILIECQAINV